MSYIVQKNNGVELNRFYEEDKSIHDWYRFVLSYPPHLVRNYIEKFNLNSNSCILDPFCGTGTTVVEAKKLGIKSIGIEANSVVHMCASTKINWDLDCSKIKKNAEKISDLAKKIITKESDSLRVLSDEKEKLIIKNSISDLPLHKTLILVSVINELEPNDEYRFFYKTALAKHLVFSFSNLKFGPEVGVSRKRKNDADVVNIWFEQVLSMCDDLMRHTDNANVFSHVFHGDSRCDLSLIEDNSIDAVITSPPYPNEKDYSRTTRLESVLLDFIKTKEDLRCLKKSFLRSNTRGVYKGDDDLLWIKDNHNINELANSIEAKRIELGKTSGFEKLYYKVVMLYFGGMAKHLHDLKPKLKNGAKLAYVVGDQASYFRIPIRTGHLLSEIAENLGYTVVGLDLFRTRLSTVTKEMLNEEVLVLEFNHEKK
ncbi:MAG: DNA methyltransferase [Plesiomonas shigelloides]